MQNVCEREKEKKMRRVKERIIERVQILLGAKNQKLVYLLNVNKIVATTQNLLQNRMKTEK